GSTAPGCPLKRVSLPSSRVVLLTTALSVAGGWLACQAPGLDEAASPLRARFQEQAPHILDAELPFAANGNGLSLATPGRPLHLQLPERTDQAASFHLDGTIIHVTELGITGGGVLTGSAVAYGRKGGTSYWSATAEGFEEWLHLEAGVADG